MSIIFCLFSVLLFAKIGRLSPFGYQQTIKHDQFGHRQKIIIVIKLDTEQDSNKEKNLSFFLSLRYTPTHIRIQIKELGMLTGNTNTPSFLINGHLQNIENRDKSAGVKLISKKY